MIKRSTPTSQRKFGIGTVLLACSGAATPAFSAAFTMLNDPALSTGFEQRWNDPAIWQYDGGVDDGTAGIPDGADTFTIDRNVGGFPAGNTDLSNEGLPDHSVAGITGTGAPGRDLILKHTGDLTIGDLTVLASGSEFHIEEERDSSLFINGVISGAGNLLISRASGFDDGVQVDEVIQISGASPNTITGNFRLFNSNNADDNLYIIADKVGAFGQTANLIFQGNGGGINSLQLTANTMGGEGAIDDDSTAVSLEGGAVFNVDAGVDEFIGSGLLNVEGIGVIGDGVYNNSASWVTGDGTVTVGIPEPGSFALLGLGGLLIARRRRG